MQMKSAEMEATGCRREGMKKWASPCLPMTEKPALGIFINSSYVHRFNELKI